jgi:proteic killer suppression protein
MINRVVLSIRARKQLLAVPAHVALKLAAWVESVETTGLESVRRVPGYHDEPLKGNRRGQRSIRLSLAYRAMYVIRNEQMEFVSVEEVSKHDY